MERFYTTTAIDYVNGAPHIGHAYEKILTDVIYRHFTQRCEDTYFCVLACFMMIQAEEFLLKWHCAAHSLAFLLVSCIHLYFFLVIL